MARFTIKRTEDRALVEKLHLELFGPKTDLDGDTFWLVFQSGRKDPVGFASARKSKAEDYAFLARAGVLKEARGHNLQRRLIRARLKWAKANQYRGAITYAANWNTSSLINLLKEGFEVYDPQVRRRGKWVLDPRDGFTYLFYKFKPTA